MGLFDKFGAQKRMSSDLSFFSAQSTFYFMGVTVKKDYEKAIASCRKAVGIFREIKKKDFLIYNDYDVIRAILSSCKLLGYETGEDTSTAEAFHSLERLAKHSEGDLAVAIANYGLAKCYHNGIFVDRNIKKAIELYEKTLIKPYPRSYMAEVIYLLGCIYLDEQEIVPDYSLAIYYLNQVTKEYPDAQSKLELAKRKKEELETLDVRISTLSALFHTIDDANEQKMLDYAESFDTIDAWLKLAWEYSGGSTLTHNIQKALYCLFRGIVVSKDRKTIIAIPGTTPAYVQEQIDEAKALMKDGKKFEEAARILEKLLKTESCAEADYLLRNLSGYGAQYCCLERLCEKIQYGNIAKTEKYPLVTCDIPTLAFWSATGKQEALDCLEECLNKVFEFEVVMGNSATSPADFVFNEKKLNDRAFREQGLLFTVDQYKIMWIVVWVWCVRVHEHLAQNGNSPSMSRSAVLWGRLDFTTGESFDYNRKRYWLYKAEKADYLPSKLSLTKTWETDIGKLSKYIEWAREGVRYGIAGAKDRLEVLQLTKAKQIQWNEAIAQSRREQQDRQIEAEMKAYREKLDNRERWFNYFATGNFISNKTDMFYQSLLGDKEGAMNDYLWLLWREKKEAEMKKKLLDEHEREREQDE